MKFFSVYIAKIILEKKEQYTDDDDDDDDDNDDDEYDDNLARWEASSCWLFLMRAE